MSVVVWLSFVSCRCTIFREYYYSLTLLQLQTMAIVYLHSLSKKLHIFHNLKVFKTNIEVSNNMLPQ